MEEFPSLQGPNGEEDDKLNGADSDQGSTQPGPDTIDEAHIQAAIARANSIYSNPFTNTTRRNTNVPSGRNRNRSLALSLPHESESRLDENQPQPGSGTALSQRHPIGGQVDATRPVQDPTHRRTSTHSFGRRRHTSSFVGENTGVIAPHHTLPTSDGFRLGSGPGESLLPPSTAQPRYRGSPASSGTNQAPRLATTNHNTPSPRPVVVGNYGNPLQESAERRRLQDQSSRAAWQSGENPRHPRQQERLAAHLPPLPPNTGESLSSPSNSQRSSGVLTHSISYHRLPQFGGQNLSPPPLDTSPGSSTPGNSHRHDHCDLPVSSRRQSPADTVELAATETSRSVSDDFVHNYDWESAEIRTAQLVRVRSGKAVSSQIQDSGLDSEDVAPVQSLTPKQASLPQSDLSPVKEEEEEEEEKSDSEDESDKEKEDFVPKSRKPHDDQGGPPSSRAGGSASAFLSGGSSFGAFRKSNTQDLSGKGHKRHRFRPLFGGQQKRYRFETAARVLQIVSDYFSLEVSLYGTLGNQNLALYIVIRVSFASVLHLEVALYFPRISSFQSEMASHIPRPGPANLGPNAGLDEWLEEAKQCHYLPERSMKELCEMVKEVLMEESNIQPVSTPVTVCGDIHGQFYDLLELFRVAGGMPGETNVQAPKTATSVITSEDLEPPTEITNPKLKKRIRNRDSIESTGDDGDGEDDSIDVTSAPRPDSAAGANTFSQSAETKFVFLGDFVDRGYFSLETFTLLMCLKAKYPDRIVLVRGNHESRQITQVYGFYEECQQKYGNASVWKACCHVFDFLVLAAIVDGELLCVHGGLSPEIRTIDQIRVVARAQEIPHEGAFCDLVWSDPEDVETWAISPRGAGWLFGDKVATEFNHVNGLKLIARAHQLVNEGYKYHFPQNSVVTVWSAPNYCYRCGNVASIMTVDKTMNPKFSIFSAVPDDQRHVPANRRGPGDYFL